MPGLVLLNGKVFTADAARSWARGLAVAGGRIVAIGDESALAPYLAGSEVIDLEGRMVAPGFIDAHAHPHHGGAHLLTCSLHHLTDAPLALRAIAGYASANPSRPWVTGGGWAQDWFERGCPSAVALDSVVPDRPAYLVNRDGHGGWANSAALALAAIDASTPDPPWGRIERLPDGSPQGTLHEAAVALVEAVMPTLTAADVESALERGQRHLLAHGITGWQDAAVQGALHGAYRALAGRSELVGSVVGALWWDRAEDLSQIEDLEAMREESVPGYAATSIKLMLDGVCENYTASMLDPYLDPHGEGVAGMGMDLIDPAELTAIVTRLDAAGFQCHFHAIGDAAVRSALDAVEAARTSNGWNDLRHHIAHLQVIHPADIGRFHRLGVVANIQPYWACEDGYQAELTQPYLGPERSARQYLFADLAAAGTTLAGGSDWPVSTCHVLDQVEVAATRRPPSDLVTPPFLADQALDPISALAAFTAGSAYVNHQEGDRGTIAVGKVADLAVLDRDPFVHRPIGEAKVAMTFVAGRLVHEEERA